MPKQEQLYIVMNNTDGFSASPDPMNKKDAKKFIKDFPKRFEAQGYYRTGRGEKIDPKDVQLEMIEYTPDDEDDEGDIKEFGPF